ncbi:MAG: hypothetical protein WCL00_15635, partial [Bacteroidota bacterium]
MKFKKNLVILLIFVILAGAILFLLSRREKPTVVPLKAISSGHYLYKIKVDSLNVTYGEVRNNQNLSSILNNFVPGQMIDRIAHESNGIFDVRRIRSGQKYTMISNRDSSGQLLYFIYEINPIDYVVYDLRDSLRVYTDKKEVKINIKKASGTITSSLWNAFDEKDLDMGLAMKLADAYAWTIDFYGLQKGDHFKMIYEEIVVDSVVTGTGQILAAVFNSGGKDFYGFMFEQNGSNGYFDDKAQSLERSFLKAPLLFSRISSRFTKSRMHPILRIARHHFGVDYAASSGT